MILKNLSNPRAEPIEMTDFLCFGSAQDNHIVLEDIEAGEKHARIEAKGKKYLLRDLRSAKGTYVNGVRTLETYIAPGDVIKMGDTEFVFQSEAQFEFFEAMVSKNQSWNAQLQKIPNIAESDLSVLILGPSGAGKELLSQYIHKISLRRDAPILTVNCSALAESLAESELFGHIKGSFTGATQDRKGAFESAKYGTLILDEIGDLPLALQPKLLRALDNREIKPVGSDRVVKTNVRIIACTHQDLRKKVENGEFRLDLFYRLNIIQVSIPPLIARMEDFEKLLFEFARQTKVKLSPCAVQELKNHNWPGNIRELKNAVSRAKAIINNGQVEAGDVRQLIDNKTVEVESYGKIQLPNAGGKPVNLIKEVEKQMILRRLLVNEGNQRKTACDLGIPKSTLSDRIKSYGINVEKILEGKGKEIWKDSDH